jgi:GNAT superfamily N-acetyltransferase
MGNPHCELRPRAEVTLEIGRVDGPGALEEYARVPMELVADEIYDVITAPNCGAIELVPRNLASPYKKDYDAIDGEGPAHWAEQFDLTHWAFFIALIDGTNVGGAAVAHDTPGVDVLEGRRDLAVLWDIRVDASVRGQGVARALFKAAEAWALASGCRQLKVETQNVNVPACRFYARQGCILGAAHTQAYPAFPDEIQLLWYKNLGPP